MDRMRAMGLGEGTGGWILEEPVGIVFDDQDVVSHTKGVDCFAAANSKST